MSCKDKLFPVSVFSLSESTNSVLKSEFQVHHGEETNDIAKLLLLFYRRNQS